MSGSVEGSPSVATSSMSVHDPSIRVVEPKSEIFTYEAPWTIYSMGWCCRRDRPYRLAIGSFIEEYSNKVRLIELNGETQQLELVCEFEHPYPASKLQFLPDKATRKRELLATTGDYMRIWEVRDDDAHSKVVLVNTLTNNKRTDYCAPVTSFDWNEEDPRLIAASSIDTTVTIWDIELGQAVTQLIAHDREVYDVAFATGTDVFGSVGADGSVRLFDRRSLDHSTIMYETSENRPLIRLGWNKLDPNYLITFSLDELDVIVLDIRVPSVPAAVLSGHREPVNSLSWAPHSSCHLCTAGEDSQALIWDVSVLPKSVDDPILAYNAENAINQLSWSVLQPDWVSIAFGSKMQILRV